MRFDVELSSNSALLSLTSYMHTGHSHVSCPWHAEIPLRWNPPYGFFLELSRGHLLFSASISGSTLQGGKRVLQLLNFLNLFVGATATPSFFRSCSTMVQLSFSKNLSICWLWVPCGFLGNLCLHHSNHKLQNKLIKPPNPGNQWSGFSDHCRDSHIRGRLDTWPKDFSPVWQSQMLVLIPLAFCCSSAVFFLLLLENHLQKWEENKSLPGKMSITSEVLGSFFSFKGTVNVLHTPPKKTQKVHLDSWKIHAIQKNPPQCPFHPGNKANMNAHYSWIRYVWYGEISGALVPSCWIRVGFIQPSHPKWIWGNFFWKKIARGWEILSLKHLHVVFLVFFH